MDLTEIKKLLHHREPYLMVSHVTAHSKDSIESICEHRGDEGHLKGHFPGAPVVPGAMIQEFCTQSAGILITKYHSPIENYDSETSRGYALGVLNKVEFAKYLEIVKPAYAIEAKIELLEKENNLFKFKARVYQAGKLKAKLKFNLVNISDSYLTEK
jgi:3-hydroxyacyl-[acyl-carrier-protein] dehydratase